MNKKNNVKIGLLFATLAAIGYASANMFDKLGLATGNPYVGVICHDWPFFLVAVGFCLYGGLYSKYLKPSSSEFIGKKAIINFVLSGPIMELGTVSFYAAMAVGGVVIAVPVVQSQVLMTAALGFFLLKETFNPKILIGSIVFIAGLILLSLGQMQGIPVSSDWMKALPLALLGGLGWAVGTVLWRRGFGHLKVNKWIGVSIHYPSAHLAIFLVLLVQGDLGAFSILTNSKTVLAFALSGVIGGLVANNAFMTSLKTAPVALANVIKSVNPILAAILAFLIFKETLNPMMLTGIIITVVGLVITMYKSGKEEELSTNDIDVKAE